MKKKISSFLLYLDIKKLLNSAPQNRLLDKIKTLRIGGKFSQKLRGISVDAKSV